MMRCLECGEEMEEIDFYKHYCLKCNLTFNVYCSKGREEAEKRLKEKQMCEVRE